MVREKSLINCLLHTPQWGSSPKPGIWELNHDLPKHPRERNLHEKHPSTASCTLPAGDRVTSWCMGRCPTTEPHRPGPMIGCFYH
ncbi:hypothetical protein D623_10006023 [Myotis brandtii]|uniref:Uncharacterized protein n=1 Tax=Myotis brandtii TaxID=109478 RepID=S7MNV0_MYOBR|nr:hypothetical protein D623_10006023 [Myotis brandtii]